MRFRDLGLLCRNWFEDTLLGSAGWHSSCAPFLQKQFNRLQKPNESCAEQQSGRHLLRSRQGSWLCRRVSETDDLPSFGRFESEHQSGVPGALNESLKCLAS